ncbi:MAG TPA: T9SS type A sorting domain-containing protein, partial [Saprospiraceae bacterium]|nr:T9SS type A sorting domain-containing protein [Saprospiraceae bacterium]
NSIGDNDIIIAKFDSIGTEVWLERYGTTENENISNLFYDNDILYFGGEFSGLNRERIIGSNRFVNLSPSTQKAYMSYILDTLGNDFNSKFPKTVSAINPQKESPNTFEVFPNPFKNVFTIELYNKDIQHFELLDMLGNIVIHQDASFKNEINVQNLQAGMYLVKGIDKTGSVVEVKKIFKN